MEMKKQIIMRIPKTRAVTESLLWIDAPIEDQYNTVRELACEQAQQQAGQLAEKQAGQLAEKQAGTQAGQRACQQDGPQAGQLAEKQAGQLADQKTRLAWFIEDQIKKKIAGYKTQDVKKGFYQPEQIMDVSGVLSSLVHCDFQCYYCKESVMVLYRNAREPRQWTLERLDNSKGHNRDNVVIACLQCNLTRKTMYHERFMFTKQLEIVKL